LTTIIAYASKSYSGIAADWLTCAWERIAQTNCDKLNKFKNYIIWTAWVSIIVDLMQMFKTTRELDKPIKTKADVYSLYLKLTKLVKEHQQAYWDKWVEGSDFDFILLTKEWKVFDCNEYGNIHEITEWITAVGSWALYAESYIIWVTDATDYDDDDIKKFLIESIKYAATRVNNTWWDIILKDFTS